MSAAHGGSEVATARDDSTGRMFPCEGCGADFEFNIEAQSLKCPYCGFEKAVEVDPDKEVAEQDLDAMLNALRDKRGATVQLGEKEVKCTACAATVVFAGNLTSKDCPYCGSPIALEAVHEAGDRIAVDGVLPFMVEKQRATTSLREWVKSRWFAPGEFKRRGVQGKFSGMYFPYWTYDAMTQTAYRGERGEYYYVQVGSGDNKRRERRTRWYPASGHFGRFFDDVLVCAARTIKRKLMHALEPWPLAKAMPFTPDVLAGYLAMTYDLPLQEGFGLAKQRIESAIESDVRRRIGGDTQRVHNIRTQFGGLTYKHMLLPVWMLAYRFKEKSYQVVVNACTGEVQGERPWSAVKIALAVIAGLAVIGGIVAAVQLSQQGNLPAELPPAAPQ